MSKRSGTMVALALAAVSCSTTDDDTPAPVQQTSTDADLRVAFIADQGLGPDAVAVLQLIRDESADFIIHAGDFDYEDNPQAWEDQINSVLGQSYPYFASIGNHDVPQWPGYQPLLAARQSRIEGADCVGEDVGVKSICSYRGLFFILSGVGTFGFYDQPTFFQESLSASDAIWNICSWHVNRRDFQTGDKDDEVGLDVMQICADHGALIINGHEHTYSRTLTLTDIDNPDAGYGAIGVPETMTLAPGQSFVTVSGLAGKSVRDYDPALHDDDTWWATLYAGGRHLFNGQETSDYQYTFGALFIDFHVDGDARKAHGYFKNIAGEIVDDFTVVVE